VDSVHLHHQDMYDVTTTSPVHVTACLWCGGSVADVWAPGRHTVREVGVVLTRIDQAGTMEAIAIWDVDGTAILQSNTSKYKLSGYPHHDVSGYPASHHLD
jgi:hypothetical protein